MMNMSTTPTRRKNTLSLLMKTLRLLGINRGFVQSSSTQKEENTRINTPEDNNSPNILALKAAETALLEIEREKAEAIMERQRRSLIC